MPRPRTDSTDPFELAPMSDSLRALARRGTPTRLRKGVQIITEGDRGDTLTIVLSGGLRAYTVGDDGNELTYALYGPGDYVGEMGLDGGPRSANVETTQASLCVRVTRGTLEQHLAQDPAFAFELLARVIRVARAATKGLRQIALNGVYKNLKKLIEDQAQDRMPYAWDPAPSHKEIGQLLGCTSAMVTTVLGDMKRGGSVEVGRRRLVLLRPWPPGW
jgi:CRP/FNR family cyclic AMP-dependent transcriptional regulator